MPKILKISILAMILFIGLFLLGGNEANAANIIYNEGSANNQDVGDQIGNQQGYQIRYDTRLKQITDFMNEPIQEGYEFDGWRVSYKDYKRTGGYDWTLIGNFSANTYILEFTYTNNDLRAVAQWKRATHRIIVNPDGVSHGSISASPREVKHGDSCTITLRPQIGYRIASLMVGQEDVKENVITKDGGFTYTYTISEVKDNCTVVVSYERIPFNLDIKSVEGATIDPTGVITVYYGDNETISISANEGYNLIGVTVNGEAKRLWEGKLFLTNITEDKEVVATVEKIKYQVLTSVNGGHGTITASKDVEHGDDFEITLTPDEGYMVDAVLVDGQKVDVEGNTYILSNVKEEHSVEVLFRKISLVVYVEEVENANVNPTGFVDVKYGEDTEINIEAKRGYQLTNITVNEEEQELPLIDGKLVLKDVKENKIIKIGIEKEKYVVLEGEEQVIDAKDGLVVKFSGDADLFVRLFVDGVAVDSSNFDIASGSTVISLHKKYLAILKEGKHTITAQYENGNTAETTFTIKAKETNNNPATGDNAMLYVSILLVSIIGIALTKKRE